MPAQYAAARVRFFLAVGLASTHVDGSRICLPEAYRAEGGARKVGADEALPVAPSRAKEKDPPLLTWPNWDLTRFDVGLRWQREVIAQYYACAAHVDAQIGALVLGLQALRLAASTAVVVQGDHGFSLGRHGRWSKYHLYEDATRVPLLMTVPGQRAPSMVTDVVEALDVMPTLLDLWGVPRRANPHPPPPPPPPSSARSLLPSPRPVYYDLGGGAGSRRMWTALEGESLLPYLQLPQSALPPTAGGGGGAAPSPPPPPPPRQKHSARSELREWTMVHRPSDAQLPGAVPRRLVGHGWQLYVRTAQFAYTAYLRASCAKGCRPQLGALLDETLYDHSADAGEAHNLAYAPAHAHTRLALLGLVLRDWNISRGGAAVAPAAPATREARVRRLDREARLRKQDRALQHAGGHSGGDGGGGGGAAEREKEEARPPQLLSHQRRRQKPPAMAEDTASPPHGRQQHHHGHRGIASAAAGAGAGAATSAGATAHHGVVGTASIDLQGADAMAAAIAPDVLAT